jgi:hypothetical protein
LLAAAGAAAADALLLLAAIGLLRCVLDPWDVIYYHVMFLLALGAWEVLARARPAWPDTSVSSGSVAAILSGAPRPPGTARATPPEHTQP